ncbi:MAG: YCF48-related protein [Chloroflexota bacterium]
MWLSLTVCLVLAVSAMGVHAQASADGWTRLLDALPGDAKLITLPIYVDPRWPDEKAVFVVRDKRLMRTLDGGATWSEVGPEPETDWKLTAFGGQRSLIRLMPDGVLRSTDDGSSWQQVLAVPTIRSRPKGVFSPRIDEDGRAMRIGGDARVHVTTDGGATWTETSPVPGQPSFDSGTWPSPGPGRELYVSVSRGEGRDGRDYYRLDGLTWARVDPLAGRPIHHVDVSGDDSIVVVTSDAGPGVDVAAAYSKDGGVTWAPIPLHLMVGDTAYRPSRSPSWRIAPDGTIFVGGIPAATGFESAEIDAAQSALFRSDDLGQTWTHLTAAPMGVDAELSRLRSLAVSPRYATDKTVVIGWSTEAAGGEPAQYFVSQSTDAGATWATTGSGTGVLWNVPVRNGPSGPIWFVVAESDKGYAFRFSGDGGKTWREGHPPGAAPLVWLEIPPSFKRDGSFFVGTETGEVWSFTPGPTP